MATMDVTKFVSQDELARYGSDGFIAEETDTTITLWHGYRILRLIKREDGTVCDLATLEYERDVALDARNDAHLKYQDALAHWDGVKHSTMPQYRALVEADKAYSVANQRVVTAIVNQYRPESPVAT